MALILARGNWTYRRLDTLSTATFRAGGIVKLLGPRTVGEMTSLVTETHLLGVALHNSADSFPPGKVTIAIPTDGCTVFAPCDAIATSALSIGNAVTFVKSGNTFSRFTTSGVTKHAVIVGPPINTSTVTLIELSFLGDALQLYSNATNAI